MSWPALPVELEGGWYVITARVQDAGGAVMLSLVILLVLALLRQTLGSTWIAAFAMLALIWLLPYAGEGPLWRLASTSLFFGLILALLVRRGLLAVAAALSVEQFLGNTLMTTHLTEWYSASASSGILATLALAGWGFYASLGGRPIFGDPIGSER